MFKKQDGKPWTGFIWLRIDTLAVCCENGNVPSSSIKCGKSDYLRNHQLLKKVCREDIPFLHKIHNKDMFNQHTTIYILVQNNICLQYNATCFNPYSRSPSGMNNSKEEQSNTFN
jgi:hypothetical protein